MSINVGDAILTFTGDTTNLDQAFERVNQTSKSKLQPVSQTIQDLGGNWQFTGQTASTAGQLSAIAGDRMAEAGRKGGAAFHETRGAVDLLAHEFGITLPRELKGFLAELGPVQGLLAGAFEGVAIFALIAALVEGTKKLSEWVAETFIFTDAMRAVDAVSVEVNKKIAEQVDELGKLKDAYALVGLAGSALTVGQFAQLSRAVDESSSKLRDLQNEIYGVRNGFVTVPEAIDVANNHIRQLFKDLPEADLNKKLLPKDADLDQVVATLGNFVDKIKAEIDTSNQQLATIQKNYDAQTLEEQIATQEARIAATRQSGEAQLNLELQLALLRNAALKNAYGADEAAQIEFNNRKYQSDLSAFIAQRALADQKLENDRKNLEIQKSLIKANDPEAAGKQAAIDQEIESIERQHAASLITIDGEIVAARKQHAAQIISDYRQMNSALEAEIQKFSDAQKAEVRSLLTSVTALPDVADTFNPWKEAILGIQGAYQTLGVNGVLPLEQQLRDERAALDELHLGYTLGIVAKDDYLRASLREIDTEIALAKALGNSTKELERQRATIRALVPEQKKHGETAVAVSQQVGNAILQEAFAYGQGALSIGQALRNITASIIQEIAKQAEVRGAAKLAEALGEVFHDPPAAATDFASAAAWFALAGGISIAAGAVAGSGREQGQPSAPGGLNPPQQTPGSTAQQNPDQTINVPHFATGGIATRRMLAMIGDTISGAGDQAEAIIPLGSNQARQMFAETFLPGLLAAMRPQEISPAQPDRFSLGTLLSQRTLSIASLPSSRSGLTDQHLDEIADRVALRIPAGEIHNHYDYSNPMTVKGSVVDAKGLMKIQTRAAKRGQGRLTSTESLRVTRR